MAMRHWLTIALLSLLTLTAVSTVAQSPPPGGNVFCAANLNCAVTGTWTFSTDPAFTNINAVNGNFSGNVVVGTMALTGPLSNVPASYTPQAQTVFATGPYVSSADVLNATTSAVLGIGPVGSAQGYALNSVTGTHLHGGMYTSQQSNQYSNYYATLLNRTGGTSQLNSFYGICLGIGDCIAHSGLIYGASGSGNQSGGIATPALQFAQPVLATWPYVFEATLTSGASSSNVFSYNGSTAQHENLAAGTRTVWDLSRTVNTGTATFGLPNVVTFSGATNMQTLNPVGWLLVLGSSSQGYAPSYNGQAGGAAGTFASFSNPGAIYAVSAPTGTGATGYLVGNQLTIVQSGCTGTTAQVYVASVDGNGQPTGYNLAVTPLGSGCSVATNLSTTGGAGNGALINITQITGVTGTAGQACRVTNFTGGTGATGTGSGGLTLPLSGTNAIAGGTAFAGTTASAIWPGYENLINATGATLSNGTATCAGNVTLNATSGPCLGDDVVIDGACWGHPQRVTAVTASNQVTVENGYDARLIAANIAGAPFILIPAAPANDLDTVGHTFQMLGGLFQATSSGGSGITQGTYLLNGVGGLAPGFTCSTPPTTPTSGNLQCAQIEVIVGSNGSVSQIVPAVSGGHAYLSAPTFTMTSSTLNILGGTANCGSTCPTFTAYLDTAPASSFQSGDSIAEPPDHRMSQAIIQGLENSSYLDASGGYVAKNYGNGANYSAFTMQGNYTYSTGGYEYGIVNSSARLNYMFNLNGQTMKYGMVQSNSAKFGDWLWNWNGASAVGGTNYAGATFNSLSAGTGQPSALPALLLKPSQSLCFGAYGGNCVAGLTGVPNAASTWITSAVATNAPVLSGAPGFTSVVATDNVNNALVVLNETSGITFAGLFSGSTGGTFHVWTSPANLLTDTAYAITRFVNGAKFGSTATAVTSTDGVGSQAVTIAPSGQIATGEMCSSVPSVSGYYCDGKTGAWTVLPASTTAYSTWSPFFENGITGTGSFAQMTLPAAITIVRLELAGTSTITGCTTWPVVGIYDQTAATMVAPITLTSGSGPWDSGALTVAVASGHILRFRVSTAGSGCTGNPAIYATMQYHN